MNRLGIALVISAPSGTGKTTLIKRLRKEFPNFGYSISCTTRAPREGEVDGKDYHFLSRERFVELRDQGHFAEWAEVHGNFYGTPLPPVREMLAKGQDILFDIDVQGGQSFRESATLSPGNDITLFDTPYGRIGLCICFDLRFEELCRLMALEGARVLLAPAAFNMTTGPAHWELLLRQRAVDNQCFTVGAAPARDEAASYVAWGHSLVCDPWGTVLHECGSGEETAVVDLDLSRVDAVRQQLPILSARRTDIYDIRRR